MRRTSKINKKDLIHGAYYAGHCRNASEARWDANNEVFVYRRYKFGSIFLEEIKHPEDDQVYDTFIVEKLILNPVKEIPLQETI